MLTPTSTVVMSSNICPFVCMINVWSHHSHHSQVLVDDRDGDELKDQGKETREVRDDLMHLVRKEGEKDYLFH